MPDEYELKARYWPLWLVIGPPTMLIALAFSWWSNFEPLYSSIGGGGAVGFWFAFFFWGKSKVRDRGKDLEEDIFRENDGRVVLPSVRFLRIRDNTINPREKERFKKKVGTFIDVAQWPTEKEEEESLRDCDVIYQDASYWLRKYVRRNLDTSMLDRENISYGFRRNLTGMKPIALSLILFSTVICVIIIQNKEGAHGDLMSLFFFVHLVCFLVWILAVNKFFVVRQANTYAKELIACAEEIDVPNTKKSPIVQ